MAKNVRAAKEVVTEMKESWNLVLKQCIAKTVIHMQLNTESALLD
jgi:hypothetical protein